MDLSSDLEKIELQETELVLPKFDFDVAWQIGSLVRNLGLTRGSPIVVDVRSFGQPWATVKSRKPEWHYNFCRCSRRL